MVMRSRRAENSVRFGHAFRHGISRPAVFIRQKARGDSVKMLPLADDLADLLPMRTPPPLFILIITQLSFFLF